MSKLNVQFAAVLTWAAAALGRDRRPNASAWREAVFQLLLVVPFTAIHALRTAGAGSTAERRRSDE